MLLPSSPSSCYAVMHCVAIASVADACIHGPCHVQPFLCPSSYCKLREFHVLTAYGFRVRVWETKLLLLQQWLALGFFCFGASMRICECRSSQKGGVCDHDVCKPAHCVQKLQAIVCLLWVAQVHAYTACPDNQTAYLAELKSGMEVLVVDAEGHHRSAIIGRVKIETRPLVSSLSAPLLMAAMPGSIRNQCVEACISFTSSMLEMHEPNIHLPWPELMHFCS